MSVIGFEFSHGLLVTRASGELAHAGEVEQVFPLASVTKLVTAWAIATVVDEGRVSWDDPAGPPDSTLRHLLAHASGVAANSDKVLAQPGKRRIYSNRGIELAADFVAGALGISVPELLSTRVTRPLGMRSWQLKSSPAYGGSCTVLDLGIFAREVLAPSLISEGVAAQLFSPQFPELSGILPGYGKQDPNPWGLGFEIRGQKSPHWTAAQADPATVGHFGQSGSFLWADRSRDLAAVFAGEKPFSVVHKETWPKLNQHILESWPIAS